MQALRLDRLRRRSVMPVADAPIEVLTAAERLRQTCRCTWSAQDQNTVIAWLAPLVDAQPAEFPLRLERRGTSWWLEKAS